MMTVALPAFSGRLKSALQFRSGFCMGFAVFGPTKVGGPGPEWILHGFAVFGPTKVGAPVPEWILHGFAVFGPTKVGGPGPEWILYGLWRPAERRISSHSQEVNYGNNTCRNSGQTGN